MIIKKSIIFLLFININAEQLKIHEFFPHLVEDFRAEYIICRSLRRQPLIKDLNFVYAPWFVLEKNSQLNIKPNLSDLENLKFENAFTICSQDTAENLIPFFKKIGINLLFTASASRKKYQDFKVVSIPYYARNASGPSASKDIYYSFIGTVSHRCRAHFFNMQHSPDTVIIKRTGFHYANKNANVLKFYEEQYRDVLSRSRFSLCPRGICPGSYRLWESLKAGAIPILISDAYLLPRGFNWNSCLIRVKEADVTKIPQILSNISKEQEEQMRLNCYRAYRLYSGRNFARVVRNYLNNLFFRSDLL